MPTDTLPEQDREAARRIADFVRIGAMDVDARSYEGQAATITSTVLGLLSMGATLREAIGADPVTLTEDIRHD